MLEKRSFSLSGHRTSVALEAEFWAALVGIAAARAGTVAGLIADVDERRRPGENLASALRVFVLNEK